MTEVLSSAEIDELLTAINAGVAEPLEEDRSSSNGRKIKVYNFKRPDKFSREQIKTITMIYNTFSHLATRSLSSFLRSRFFVHVASVDQLTYEEFTRCIPSPSTLAIINMAPLKGNAVLEINPAITFSIVDRLFGGFGEGTKSQHELTAIERSVMEEVITLMLKNMKTAWTGALDICPRLVEIKTIPKFVQISPPDEMVILVTLETKIGNVEGMMNFCIPYFVTEPITDKLSDPYGGWKRRTHTKDYRLVKRENIPVKLTAEILSCDYSLKEIKDWKKGTVIMPQCQLTQNNCYIRLGNRRVWQCKILEDSKNNPKKIVIANYAKKPFGTEGMKMETNMVNQSVTNALEMAKVRISVELGAAEMTVKEVYGIGEETIIELDRLAGEMVDVMANGVLIAKGEVVVIGENLGVKIVETAESPAKQEAKTPEAQNE